MPITNVNSETAYAAYAKPADAAVKATKPVQNEKVMDEEESKAATFEKSDSTPVKTGYEKTNRLTKEQIVKLESMREESLRNMVTQLLSLQAKGKSVKSSAPNVAEILPAANTEAVSAESAEGEDFYGVDAVATRIMDMAVSLSGGDTSKIETLKNAVIKGFEEAGVAFGQELPEVCDKTYDEIMKRFDYWKENGSLDGYTYKASEED